MKNKLIQSLSGLGILLVVLGHSRGVLPNLEAEISEIDKLYNFLLNSLNVIVTFHVPLFFFISGYLFLYTKSNIEVKWTIFLMKKIKRLIIPYVFISSLAFPLKVFISKYAMRPQNFSLICYIESIFQPWKNTIIFFWFLPTLFVIFIIGKLLIRQQKSILYDLFLFIFFLICNLLFKHKYNSGFLSFMNIGGALHYFSFFISGAIVFKYRLNFVIHSKYYFVLMFPIIILTYLYLTHVTGFVFLLFMAFSGIMFCSGIVKLLNFKGFELLGIYSYQIYLLSWFPQIFIRIFFGQIFYFNIWLNVFLSLVLGILLPIGFVINIKRSQKRFLKTCFGV